MRDAYDRLQPIIEQADCAAIGLTWPNKRSDGGGGTALDRLMGSRAHSAWARSVIGVGTEWSPEGEAIPNTCAPEVVDGCQTG